MTEMSLLKESLTHSNDRPKYKRYDCVCECMHVAEWEDVELRRYVCYWIKQDHVWEENKTDAILVVLERSNHSTLIYPSQVTQLLGQCHSSHNTIKNIERFFYFLLND